MHSLIYHLIKHLLRGLVIVAQHLIHHAPAAHTAAVRHAATAHTVAAHTLGGTQRAGGLSTAMPAAHVGDFSLFSS